MRYLLTAVLGLLTLGVFYSCQKEISVEYGTPAKGSLQFDLTFDCTPKTVRGSFVAGKALNDSNYIDATVIVVSPGPYTIFTDTTNGYSFKATGTFAAAGTTTVRLKGSGTPAVNRIDDFTIFFDSSDCAISITVEPAGSTSGCNPNLQGNYKAGTAMDATNKVVLSHTYTTAGPYTIGTDTVNGYYFGPVSYIATAGANTNIALTATGTPIAAGTNNFTVRFSDGQTCTFTVTVTSGTTPPPVNTDYFPTTLNSWWSYNDGATDTFKITNKGPVVPPNQTGTPQTYQRFEYSDAGGPFYDEFYRKDATNGFYYQLLDTAGFGQQGLSFTQATLDVLFLKNSLSNGATWNTDFMITFNSAPTTLRFKYTCVEANATVTVAGKTFTNVYRVKFNFQIQSPAGFVDAGSAIEYYYARGIGLVWVDYPTGFDDQTVRFWQVN